MTTKNLTPKAEQPAETTDEAIIAAVEEPTPAPLEKTTPPRRRGTPTQRARA